MGKELTKITNAVLQAKNNSLAEWQDFCKERAKYKSEYDTASKLCENMKKEKDKTKQKKMRDDLKKQITVLQKSKRKQKDRLDSAAEWNTKLYARMSHLRTHIQKRERESMWRTAKHTTSAKETLRLMDSFCTTMTKNTSSYNGYDWWS